MARVSLEHGTLSVIVEGVDQIFAFAHRITVPLEHVSGASPASAEARRWYKGIRFGTNLPGILTAGHFYHEHGWVFWDVHHPEKAIAIALHDERYTRLVIQVEAPDATVAEITAALHERRP